MDIDLKGKRAIVCGSTQGIGLAVANELADLGASITLIARNEAKLREVVERLPTSPGQQHHYLCVDFNEPDKLENAIKQYLGTVAEVHVLINNTGGPPAGKSNRRTYFRVLTRI